MIGRLPLKLGRPHANTYDLTPDGLAFAIFYTKVRDRVLAPLFTAGQPPAPPATPRRPAHHRAAHRRTPSLRKVPRCVDVVLMPAGHMIC